MQILCVWSSCALFRILERNSDLALGAGPRLIISLFLSQVLVALEVFLVSSFIFSS